MREGGNPPEPANAGRGSIGKRLGLFTEPGDRNMPGPRERWKLEPGMRQDVFPLLLSALAALRKAVRSPPLQPRPGATGSQAPAPHVSATGREVADVHFQKSWERR